MKKLAITILITLTATIVLLAALVALNGDNGIVTLEGYEHGVAFCENKISTVVHTNDATVWSDGTANYVINAGHYNDPEVKELVALAKVECAKYE